MPQYMISVWHDETYSVDFSTPDAQRRVALVGKFNEELQRVGAWVFAAGLHPSSSATVVRSLDGRVSMTDGPYAETKEALLGFYLIDCASLDEAIETAKAIGRDEKVVFEIRPVKLFLPNGIAK